MLPIARREYYCPVCGHKEKHSTNHQGEIYCSCKQCGNTPIYCSEVDAHAGLPFKTATIRFYYFANLDKDVAERKAYNELQEKLNDCFKVLCEPRSFTALRQHDGKTVKLYDPDQFPDQFVSDIGRLHKWYEAVFPNRNIRAGYYLEIND